MDLWTEYEGATIDSAFALKKLVQTEGRSAFFSTLNANGESVLIRIIECHFDEDEILARWRGVQTLSHPNFLRMDRFGQFRIEDNGVTAVYAVFERVDENLGAVLERGRLTATDAAEIGLSVASALEALHANGFVHEHIQAGKIYAVGENVKLRSDCIRETPEGEAGIEARRRDAHDLVAVLRQVLLGTPNGSATQRQNLLPAPFDEIVGNGMNGSWGIAEIKAALGRCELPKAAKKRATTPEPAHATAARSAREAASPAVSATAAPSSNGFSPKAIRGDTHAKPDPRPELSESSAFKAPAPVLLPGQKPSPMEVPVIFGISERAFRKWLTVGVLVLGAVVLGWILLHHWFGHRTGAGAQADSARAAAASSHAIAMPPMASSRVDRMHRLRRRRGREPASSGALWSSLTTARTRRRRRRCRWRSSIPASLSRCSRQTAERRGW